MRGKRVLPILSRTDALGRSGSLAISKFPIISVSAKFIIPLPKMRPLDASVDTLSRTYGVIVIDTPGHDSYLMRLAHSLADTLVTPLNDSFVDLDVLGTVDPRTFEVT